MKIPGGVLRWLCTCSFGRNGGDSAGRGVCGKTKDRELCLRCLAGGFLMFFLVFALAMYVYCGAGAFHHRAKRRIRKMGWLAWIPIANNYSDAEHCRKPIWWIVLWLIPLVNIVIFIIRIIFAIDPGQPTILRIVFCAMVESAAPHTHTWQARKQEKTSESACKQRRQSSRSFVLRKRRGRQNRRHSYHEHVHNHLSTPPGIFIESSTQRRLDVIRAPNGFRLGDCLARSNAFTELCLNCPLTGGACGLPGLLLATFFGLQALQEIQRSASDIPPPNLKQHHAPSADLPLPRIPKRTTPEKSPTPRSNPPRKTEIRVRKKSLQEYSEKFAP